MKFHSLFLTALAALSLGLGGCSDDDIVSGPDGDGDSAQITFSIGVASRTTDYSRAVLQYDNGLDGERQVNNAMIIIYDRPLNTPGDDGKVVKVVYLDKLGKDYAGETAEATYVDPSPSYYPQTDVLNYVKVGKVKVSDKYVYKENAEDKANVFSIDESKRPLEVGRRYYATALCNFGNLSTTFEDMSLKDFRDYIYKGNLYDAKNADIKKYDNFRMTGLNETSFIWERESAGAVNLGSFLVQRLAARLDVMLGDVDVDYYNPDIRLNIYTEDSDGKLKVTNQYFYLTDLSIINNVNAIATGSYLVERSSVYSPSFRDDKGNAPVPVYFDNEGWAASGSNYLTNASKYVYSPSPKSHETEYSLYQKAGYASFQDLISAGSFYYDNDAIVNKRNSALVGYLTENTNSSNYTVLRIKGRTNASTSEIFPNVSRAVPELGGADGYYEVTGEIPIRHNLDTESDRMRYAIVRNTIYRVRIKVIARENKIYFRYYYTEPGANNQKDYTDHTPFIQEVGENNKPGSVTPID